MFSRCKHRPWHATRSAIHRMRLQCVLKVTIYPSKCRVNNGIRDSRCPCVIPPPVATVEARNHARELYTQVVSEQETATPEGVGGAEPGLNPPAPACG